jgi:hypothetical protein
LEIASGGGRRGGCARGSRLRAAVGKKMSLCFLIFLEKPCRTEDGADEA